MVSRAGLSVGIVALWYGAEELLPYWHELLLVAPEWDHVILVDNATSPATGQAYQAAARALAEASGRRVDVLRRAENSVLHGWNAGAALLDTDIIITMACDVLLTDARWLAWCVEDMQPNVLQGPFCTTSPQVPDVPYIDGCCAVYLRSDWQRLGGLAADRYAHPGYWSDVDIAWRAQQMGMQVRGCQNGLRHLTNYVVKRTLSGAERDASTAGNFAEFIYMVHTAQKAAARLAAGGR